MAMTHSPLEPAEAASDASPVEPDDSDREEAFVHSLARGLAVIEAFHPGRERLTMSQVAAACGLTRAGARRVLLTLNQLGYVGIDGRFFQLTPRIIELSAGYVPRSPWEAAQPVLDEVAAALGQPASAGVLDGQDVVYKVRARPAKVMHVEISPGARLPAFAHSMGRVLLAALPEDELEDFLASVETAKLTPFTLEGREALRERIAQVRRDGWAFAVREIDERYACVAVPVVSRRGETLAALNVGLPVALATPEFVEARVLPALRQAAEKVAAGL